MNDIYFSQLLRKFLRCRFDEESLSELSSALCEVPVKELRSGNWYCGRSRTHTCNKCGERLVSDSAKYDIDIKKSNTTTRKVDLHTLNAGTLRICVVDLTCQNCGAKNYYDSRDDGLFALSEHVVYTSEILDYWLYQVYCLSLRFRAAFESFQAYINSLSARLSRRNVPFRCSRRSSNTAFSKFLSILVFPPESALSSIFTCSTCERRENDGERILDPVVIDGTAVGILGILPNYRRICATVPRVTKCIPQLYLMRTPATRRFLDDLFIAAAKTLRQRHLRYLYMVMPKILVSWSSYSEKRRS